MITEPLNDQQTLVSIEHLSLQLEDISLFILKNKTIKNKWMKPDCPCKI